MRRLRGAELALAAASLLAVVVALETGLRVHAWWEDRGALARALAMPPRVRPDAGADLGDVVRLAPERRRVYELVPGTRALLRNVLGATPTPLVLNGEGFRDRDYPHAKPSGVRRLVGIGDSYMFGWGVHTGKDYLSVLEHELARTPGVGRWEVLNLAVPGYNTAMEVETLRARGLAYAPDVVVVGFCWNDFDLPNFIRTPAEHLSLDRLFLVDFVRGRLARADLVTAPRDAGGSLFESDPARVPAEYRDLVGYGAFAAAMADLATLAREHGFEVIFLVFEPDGLGGPIRDARRRQGVAEAVRVGFTVLDVGAAQAEWMRRRKIPDFYGSTLTLSGTDPHPSVLSHWIAAQVLLRHLLLRAAGAQ